MSLALQGLGCKQKSTAAPTLHVQFTADKVLHVAHEGPHFQAGVWVVGHVATDELLLRGGFVQLQQVGHLSHLGLDGPTHLQVIGPSWQSLSRQLCTFSGRMHGAQYTHRTLMPHRKAGSNSTRVASM